MPMDSVLVGGRVCTKEVRTKELILADTAFVLPWFFVVALVYILRGFRSGFVGADSHS